MVVDPRAPYPTNSRAHPVAVHHFRRVEWSVVCI